MKYRIKQLLYALFYRSSKKEHDFVANYLNDIEKNLFYRLRGSEQGHSIRVAKRCVKLKDDSEFIKAALLHDVGKVDTNLNLFMKSLLVFVEKFNIKISFSKTLISAQESKNSHSERGAALLKSIGCSEYVINLVKNHHKESTDNKDLKLLIECDNKE